jgi:hypothetical protein
MTYKNSVTIQINSCLILGLGKNFSGYTRKSYNQYIKISRAGTFRAENSRTTGANSSNFDNI